MIDPTPPDAPAPAPVSSTREGLARARTWGWLRRFAKLWGFALFCVFVVYTFREVALPFLFAVLVAYILAPLVDRFARLKIRGKPFPRGLAVIILYINIIALLSIFISYFIPKLSSDFARMFREAPQMIRRVNRQWVPARGRLDRRTLRGRRSHHAGCAGSGRAARSMGGARNGSHAAPARDRRHEILIEPLADGKLRVDLQSVRLEVEPGPGGKYIITSARTEATEVSGEGKWQRSIKQWIAERVKSTEGESRRALEWGRSVRDRRWLPESRVRCWS